MADEAPRIEGAAANRARTAQRVFAMLAALIAIAITLLYVMPAASAWRDAGRQWERVAGNVVATRVLGFREAPLRLLTQGGVGLQVDYTYSANGRRYEGSGEVANLPSRERAERAREAFRDGTRLDVLVSADDASRSTLPEVQARAGRPAGRLAVGVALVALAGWGARRLWRTA
jgi:hypothetical protein